MKEIYDWVPYFTKLSEKIADGGPPYLAERAKKVRWRNDGKEQAILSYGDDNIDPFSFLYTIASKSTTYSSRQTIYPSLSEIFALPKLTDDDAEHTFVFPTPTAFSLLFHYHGRGNPELLWRLFRQAVTGVDSIAEQDFDAALRTKSIAITKLTQALFLANPHKFLPLDDKLRPLGITEWPRNPHWADYRRTLAKIRESFPGCAPYDINLFAWLIFDEQLRIHPERCFQVSANVEGKPNGKDYWEDFADQNQVFTGGPKSGIPWNNYRGGELSGGYGLSIPKPGDLMLVRHGEKPRGIGVVLKNDYAEELSAKSKLHVLWISKTASLGKSLNLPIVGFSRAGDGTIEEFRSVGEYKPSFELLDRLGRQDEPATERREVRDNDPKPEVMPPPQRHSLNRVLYGPPGTGKTFSAVRHALAIIDGTSVQDTEHNHERFNALRFDPETQTGQIAMVTFHQNYAYEDFVEGIRPVLADEAESGAKIAYQLRDGIFKRIADAASKRQDDRFVLIIDEINRGNIAKIFGELITLIEDSRRRGEEDETVVTLPYSAESFSVPGNLYIIGTMNTADRSIQLLDTALRRRFTFVEMMPNPEHDLVPKNVEGVDCRRILKAMNDRITVLMDREHQIGHTYFRKVEDIEQLANAFRNQIFPLLQEYFFDDWGKIRRVLNDNGFVATANAASLLPPEEHSDEDTTIYERLRHDDEKWSDPEKYKAIYATNDSA